MLSAPSQNLTGFHPSAAQDNTLTLTSHENPKSGNVWKSPSSRASPSLQRRWYCSSFPPSERGKIPGIELVCWSGSRLECLSGPHLLWVNVSSVYQKQTDQNASWAWKRHIRAVSQVWFFCWTKGFLVHQAVQPPERSPSRRTGCSGSILP